MPDDRSQSRIAFDELLATLSEVADRYAGPEWGLMTPDDVAGGLRSVANLLEGGLVGHFEDDPATPVFRQIVTSTRKSLGDNADAVYFDAAVSSAYSYRVRGRTAGAVYVSFTVETGAHDGRFMTGTGGVLNDTQFDVDAAGRFEIHLNGPARERNWLPLPDNAARITTRHYWEQERSPAIPPIPDVALEIEALDAPGPPPPPDDVSVAAGLRRVANYVRSRSLEQTRPGTGEQPAFVSREPNVFPKPVTPGTHALAAVDAAYSMAPYVLGPEEALVMTGRWPAHCRCANVSLWNRHLQTYDYAHRTVSLNRVQTKPERDGTFRIVIAHRDPGVPNWLDTEGRPFGMVFWRFFLPDGDIDTPQAEVVPVDDVAVS